jgi:hypothetical protein
MPRYPTRLLASALISALFLVPTFAAARPAHKDTALSASKLSVAKPNVLSRIQGLLSALWAENGSILEPNGAGTGTNSTAGTEPTSDNGSILEPNG